ncbi:MAG: tetratricopeptide repeat protein [Deltaproteobacteria bacterium]|nr:tetratricopeptide repeat protein [Deltaproteobacteria bacterium]
MRRTTCRQVEASIAAYTNSELSADERAAIAVHLDVCESCRELAETWTALPTVTREAEIGDHTQGPRARADRRPPIGIALAAAIALALGVTIWLALDQNTSSDEIDNIAEAALADARTEGSALGDGPRTQLAIDGRGRRVLDVGHGTRMILDDSARARLEPCVGDTSVDRAALESGSAVVEVGSSERDVELIVETPAGFVLAREAVYSLEVAADETVWVRVAEGVVFTRDSAGEIAEVLSAGQQVHLKVSANPTADEIEDGRGLIADQSAFERGTGGAAPPLDELLKQARAHRKARDFERAAASYNRLIKTFPGSATAKSSLVALGQMELGSMGRAESALAHFDAYLNAAPGGVLAEEARAGKVRAQARLGRTRGLISTASDYLRAHPKGRAASEMLRRRADARRQIGTCADAIRDYRQVLDRWPGSTEAELAAKGLDACSTAP